jgi:hypothetical protein
VSGTKLAGQYLIVSQGTDNADRSCMKSHSGGRLRRPPVQIYWRGRAVSETHPGNDPQLPPPNVTGATTTILVEASTPRGS